MPVATLSEAPEFALGDAVFRSLAVPSLAPPNSRSGRSNSPPA